MIFLSRINSEQFLSQSSHKTSFIFYAPYIDYALDSIQITPVFVFFDSWIQLRTINRWPTFNSPQAPMTSHWSRKIRMPLQASLTKWNVSHPPYPNHIVIHSRKKNRPGENLRSYKRRSIDKNGIWIFETPLWVTLCDNPWQGRPVFQFLG